MRSQFHVPTGALPLGTVLSGVATVRIPLLRVGQGSGRLLSQVTAVRGAGMAWGVCGLRSDDLPLIRTLTAKRGAAPGSFPHSLRNAGRRAAPAGW